MIAPSVNTALGLCIGASTIKVVTLRSEGEAWELTHRQVQPHNCDLRSRLSTTLDAFAPSAYDFVCATGRHHRQLVNLPAVTEPEAIEEALRLVLSRGAPRRAARAVLSLGSENFIVYELNASGGIAGIRTGNKCGSGTGEFFLQQIGRMNLSVDEAGSLARAAEPFSVCGRCSVFCKSDCTHALNKGIPADRVAAGLGNMIADKAIEILGTLPRRDIMVVGGVTNNEAVMERLRGQIDSMWIPEEADVFEAFGAAACALRLRGRSSGAVRLSDRRSSFGALPPLAEADSLVTFRAQESDVARDGDDAVLGLDVGSTTTKAVLLRTSDRRMLASVYLRTNGNPIHASRECYRAIEERIGDARVAIAALGVTGSGRHIAGLHAQTRGVINEIIAHATAAAHFDPDVDTIFEIGGQDAKYTYLVNGVPCDYAMNEACSAGTGSFLEEAARESLRIDYREIQEIAMRAAAPPNFNDQCAAFISSDIKNASHEVSREDIVAGLVYSICMNYANRVKGSRKVGGRIFMQGGVCYNRAVPLAMAGLLRKPIIVPPDPGLMGAFGVALEALQRLELGLLEPSAFDLRELAERDVAYGKTFACRGTSEQCDRGCEISVIKLDGKNYPFGGACNKYSNVAQDRRIDPQPFDFVAKRQAALYAAPPSEGRPGARSIGMSRSFTVNLLYPLYIEFFSSLGLRVVLPDAIDPEGLGRVNAAFCYPAVLAHGMFADIAKQKADFLFLPHVHELHVSNGHVQPPGHQCTCITGLAEAYYLKSAFPEEKSRIVSPHFNFAAGWDAAKPDFVRLAVDLGFTAAEGDEAFRSAMRKQNAFFEYRRELGRAALEELAADPKQIGIVLFGRPYNAFAEEANMGIPRKFASRGVRIIPFDSLPLQNLPTPDRMTWALGQDLLRAAAFIKEHPQLYGAFITNFSCGPDSFLVGQFREMMRTKPSLTLEIDSHTADAGINTRIEAFLDIIERYRRMGISDGRSEPFRPAGVVNRGGKTFYRDSDGEEMSLHDRRVKVVFPSMGRTLVEAGSAVFRGLGIRSAVVAHPSPKTLMAGRAHTCCKECLPLILSVGSLVEYLETIREPDERLLYFMPTSNGNCRFSQYSVFFDRFIAQKRLSNVAVYTLTSENGYSGLGPGAAGKLLSAMIVADAMDDIRNAIHVLAADREPALEEFARVWNDILGCLERGSRGLDACLRRAASRLAAIPRRADIDSVKHVLLAGEIYVRKDEFSSQRVVEALAERDIVVQRAPMLEWIQYVDYWVHHVERRRLRLSDRFEMKLRDFHMRRMERRIKQTLARSGFYRCEVGDIEEILEAGETFIDKSFGGETILVVGRFLKDILTHFHGIISIGPFACLPARIIESVLTPEAKRLGWADPDGRTRGTNNLPFLSIESDGNPFPQTIEAQLEAFCLQVRRTPDRVGGTRV